MESSSSSSLAAPGGPLRREGHSRSSSGASAHSLGAQSHGVTTSTPRSLSMNSISSDGSLPSDSGLVPTAGQASLVEQEDIVVLTHNVRSFKEALGKLKRIFHPDKEKRETMHVAAHERLGDVLRILRSILEKYPDIQSTDLLMTAGTLIQQVKSYSYDDEKEDPTEFIEAIDQLALSFSSRVSEYLMGDLDSSSGIPLAKTKSFDNLLTEADSNDSHPHGSILTPTEVDQRLVLLTEGVDLALRRAKLWSKYAKDVMTYIEKRAALESEYARNLSKLAQLIRPVLKEESYLPFQSIYCTALDQDLENAKTHVATCSLLQGHKFIEPLSNRRVEHEKSRKQIKELWHRELKKMHEAVGNLRKAKSLYIQRHLEHEKAKESALRAASGSQSEEVSRVERKRKVEDDAHQKALEAETTYKSCVLEANDRQQNLEKIKTEVLQQVRELIYQCDQTMKAVTVCYFQLQHTVSAPAPVQFQTLCESSRLYEPGTQYMEYVRRLPIPAGHKAGCIPFTFEPFHSLADRSTESMDDAHMEYRCGEGKEGSHHTRGWGHGTPLAAVVAAGGMGGSDSDSVSSFHSNKSQDSPTASPCVPVRKNASAAASSGEELETDLEHRAESRGCISKAAETHNFRKLKTPSRCRECDAYVYFQGTECSECGLACHRRCLETLAIQCGHRRLPRKMTTFGVALGSHPPTGSSSSSPMTSPRGSSDQTTIPDIVLKCMAEIEKKGIFIKGIYRVSGVKSKVEKLCQSFESGAELVDLTEVHPSIIANVLKLYLRQLPEPLLTYRFYPDFIRIAKDHHSQRDDDLEMAAKELTDLVSQLPPVHLATLAALMHHLKRISEYSEHNHMPPSNLGIVFGPTLLRTSDGSASLTSLVDTVHQTRVVEILIRCADAIFAKESNQLRVGPSDPVSVRSSSRVVPSPLVRERAQEVDLEEEEEGEDSVLAVTTIPNQSTREREHAISSSLPGSEDHSSDDWLGSSVFSDDELSEILGSSEVSPLQQKCSMSSVEENQAEYPVPPPRKNAPHHQTPLSTSSSSSGDQVFMSTAQVTLGGGSLPNRGSGPMPTTAELRRQFFESPPVVLKAISQSLPPSPPPSFSTEGSPAAPTTAHLLAQAARLDDYMPTCSEGALTDTPTARKAAEKGYDFPTGTSSPLTSSISHLGLNTLLRPFSTSGLPQLGSSSMQVQTSRHYNGKWTTLSSSSSSSGVSPITTRQEVTEERSLVSSSSGFWKENSSVQKTTESSYAVQQHSESSGYESDKGMSRHAHYV